jgi:hypothetical protein
MFLRPCRSPARSETPSRRRTAMRRIEDRRVAAAFERSDVLPA